MKAFKVTGSFLMGKKYQKFEKEVLAQDKDLAQERIYTVLGSKHGVKRQKVNIEKVHELKREEIEDPYIEEKLGGM